MTNKDKTPEQKESYLQKLFNHMSNEHGLILTESEMQEIVEVCKSEDDCEVSLLREALRGSLIMLEQLIENTEGYFKIELDGYRKELNEAKQLIGLKNHKEE